MHFVCVQTFGMPYTTRFISNHKNNQCSEISYFKSGTACHSTVKIKFYN